MSMEYFCCYHSYRRKVAKLSDQEVGRLFRALLEYSETGEAPELTGRESVAFDFIADDIDRSKENYSNMCAANSKNGAKGGRPKKHTVLEKAVGFSKSEKSQNENKNENKNETISLSDESEALSEESATPARAKKTQKHKYGQYKHVQLTDTEYEKLHKEFDNADEAIVYLDEYIEMKGYKAKSHYQAIRKWVFDAIKEQEIRRSRLQSRASPAPSPGGYSFGDYLREEIEKELTTNDQS